MTPNFALNLTHDGITLLHRGQIGWYEAGHVRLDDPQLDQGLAALRKTASELSGGAFCCKLILPNSQILYTLAAASGLDRIADQARVETALDGATPYQIDELSYDWVVDQGMINIAVVARETLAEAEAFAADHGFNPVSFVAIPPETAFLGEPFFGETKLAAKVLEPGDFVQRESAAVVITAAPEPLPEEIPKEIPEEIPDPVAEDVPDVAPEVTPEAVPESVAESAPESVPAPEADALPDAVAQVAPEEETEPEAPALSDPAQPDPAPADPVVPDPVVADPVQPDAVQTDSVLTAALAAAADSLAPKDGVSPAPQDGDARPDTNTADAAPPPETIQETIQAPADPEAAPDPVPDPVSQKAPQPDLAPATDPAPEPAPDPRPTFASMRSHARGEIPAAVVSAPAAEKRATKAEPSDAPADPATPSLAERAISFGRFRNKPAPDTAQAPSAPQVPVTASPEDGASAAAASLSAKPSLGAATFASLRRGLSEKIAGHAKLDRPEETAQQDSAPAPVADLDPAPAAEFTAAPRVRVTEPQAPPRRTATKIEELPEIPDKFSRPDPTVQITPAQAATLSEPLIPAGMRDPLSDQPPAAPHPTAPRSEAESMTVFGARRALNDPEERPRILGLALTAAILLIMALVALWTMMNRDPEIQDVEAETAVQDGQQQALAAPDPAAPTTITPETIAPAPAEPETATAKPAPVDPAPPVLPAPSNLEVAQTPEDPGHAGLNGATPRTAAVAPDAMIGPPALPADQTHLQLVRPDTEALPATGPTQDTEIGPPVDIAEQNNGAQDTAEQGTEEQDIATRETPGGGTDFQAARDAMALNGASAMVGPQLPPETPPDTAPDIATAVSTEGADTDLDAPLRADLVGEAALPLPLDIDSARAAYAATGVWQRAPERAPSPAEDELESLYVASIDPDIGSHDAIALPVPSESTQTRPDTPANPLPFGVVVTLGPDGMVVPTPEGAMAPGGIYVYAGKPDIVPPRRPASLAPAAEAPVTTRDVAGLRPRSRPADLSETNEKATLGGRTRSELAALRPKPRPQSEQDNAAAINAAVAAIADDTGTGADAGADAPNSADFASATARAIPSSPIPRLRPANMAQIADRARRGAEKARQTQAQTAAQAVAQADAATQAAKATPTPAPTTTPKAKPAAPAAAASTAAVSSGRSGPAVARNQRVKPKVPSSKTVAKQATVKNALAMHKVSLIGIYGSPNKRRALVRLPSGRMVKVSVGDKVDGGKVASISESEIRYVKGGRDVVLKVPKG